MIERRRAPRIPAGLEALVTVPLRPPLAASVTDISAHGAMVEVDRHEYVPATFALTIGSFTTKCTVRHRCGRKIGVEFATLYDWSQAGAHQFAASLAPGQRVAWQPPT